MQEIPIRQSLSMPEPHGWPILWQRSLSFLVGKAWLLSPLEGLDGEGRRRRTLQLSQDSVHPKTLNIWKNADLTKKQQLFGMMLFVVVIWIL